MLRVVRHLRARIDTRWEQVVLRVAASPRVVDGRWHPPSISRRPLPCRCHYCPCGRPQWRSAVGVGDDSTIRASVGRRRSHCAANHLRHQATTTLAAPTSRRYFANSHSTETILVSPGFPASFLLHPTSPPRRAHPAGLRAPPLWVRHVRPPESCRPTSPRHPTNSCGTPTPLFKPPAPSSPSPTASPPTPTRAPPASRSGFPTAPFEQHHSPTSPESPAFPAPTSDPTPLFPRRQLAFITILKPN